MDFEINKKGFGPGVNKVISTGSKVMVGRLEGVNDGMGVFVASGAPICCVLVGPAVLMAKRSGVFEEIDVTLG